MPSSFPISMSALISSSVTSPGFAAGFVPSSLIIPLTTFVKIIITIETAIVSTTMPLLSPIRDTAIIVTMEAMSVFTMLLVTNIVLKNFSGVSRIFNTILAVLDLPEARRLILRRFTAIIDISEAAVRNVMNKRNMSRTSTNIFIYAPLWFDDSAGDDQLDGVFNRHLQELHFSLRDKH